MRKVIIFCLCVTSLSATAAQMCRRTIDPTATVLDYETDMSSPEWVVYLDGLELHGVGTCSTMSDKIDTYSVESTVYDTLAALRQSDVSIISRTFTNMLRNVVSDPDVMSIFVKYSGMSQQELVSMLSVMGSVQPISWSDVTDSWFGTFGLYEGYLLIGAQLSDDFISNNLIDDAIKVHYCFCRMTKPYVSQTVVLALPGGTECGFCPNYCAYGYYDNHNDINDKNFREQILTPAQ